MLSGKYRIIALSILFIVITASIIFAGTTGKITGRVVDKENGEPLFGASVRVQGTTLGAATDIDGYYVILNVPPGIQTLIVSMIGYTSLTVSEIRVRIDETSPVNVELTPQAIEAGSVVVIAERNIIKQDVSTSVTAIQPDEISSLPVSSINDVIGLQAGVEEGLVIRGGGSDQVLIQLDGITLRDPRNNMPISTIALSSIQEVSIEKGGFNAEYGQVQSGVINIVAREGGTTDYYGAVQFRYSPPAAKHFGISVYDPNSMWNRPYLDPAVSWTGTQNPQSGDWDSYYTSRQYPDFKGWNFYSEQLLKDDDPNNDLSPTALQSIWKWQHRRRPKTDQPDYNIDASFGGPVPFISKELGNLRFFTSYRLEREMFLVPLSRDDFKEYNWSMKLNSDITDNIKLMLTGSTGKFYTSALNIDDNNSANATFGQFTSVGWSPTSYFRSPISIAQVINDGRSSRIFTDSWYSDAEVGHTTLSGRLTQLINASTYYDVSFEYMNRQYKTGPLRNRDTSKSYEVVPGYFVDEAPYGYDWHSSSALGEDLFFFGGHSSQLRDTSKVSSYKMKFDFTSQINKENLVKFGVEFSYFDLHLNYAKVEPAFGDIIVDERWKPYQFSAYLQDKIEMYGFIANVGLRMDLSNPNTEWADVDPFDKSYFSGDYRPTTDYPTKKANVDITFSPRLGISHPITENSKLYFNYGHFKQLPAYQEIFRIGRGSSRALSNFGDPNLVLAKTIAYELGYDHVLFNSYLLQLQAFYRDISDQQGFTTYTSGRKSIGYSKMTNNNYADIRGFELTFKKTEGDWLRGFATYTYQVVTNGAFGNTRIDDDPVQQRINDQNTQLLYQQKPVPQPHARLSLTFITPKDLGPEFSGIQPLGNWSLDVLADWRAGQYINYNPNNVVEISNIVQNVQTTDNFNIDLRLNKSFDLKYFDLMLFIDVRNLLNTKRLSGAGFYTGSPTTGDMGDYFSSLHLPESSAYNNVPGDDRIGDYRKEGVAFQPIELLSNVKLVNPTSLNPNQVNKAIFYDRASRNYFRVVNGEWSQVGDGEMQKILDDKAYIDMPNNTSFNFLDPRQIFFGINLSFKL
jgi:outer membrane receptor protein involved in Fe transport